MAAQIFYLSDYLARRSLQRQQVANALLSASDGFRLCAAECEAAAGLEDRRQLECVSRVQAASVEGAEALADLADHLMRVAPRKPLGGKETA